MKFKNRNGVAVLVAIMVLQEKKKYGLNWSGHSTVCEVDDSTCILQLEVVRLADLEKKCTKNLFLLKEI